jgi:hypothetical protein
VYGDDKGSVERIDAAGGGISPVLTDLQDSGPTDVVIDDDMSAVSGLDQSWQAHELVLGSGRSIPLGRCEEVVALDATGQTALIDGQTLCTPGLGAPALPAPPVPDRVVDMATGRTLLDLGTMQIWGGTFGPVGADGRAALVVVQDASAHNALHVYDLRSGSEIGAYTPSQGGLLRVAVSPDVANVLTTTSTGKLIVLDLARLAKTANPDDAVAWSVKAHDGSVQALAVSAHGLIATGSSAGNVRVWSRDGRLLADLPIHPDDVPNAAFAHGTDVLYYEDGNGVIRRFDPDVGSEVRLARSLVTRSFTADECARYFPHQRCPDLSH